jgi:hypothetical protein
VAPSGVAALRVAALGAALTGLSLGCAAGVQGPVAEMRSKLVGVDARALRGCVGVPTSVDVEGDQEVHMYRFSEDSSPLDRFPVGLSPAQRIGSRDRTRPETQGFCELTFRLQAGRVQDVQVKGRRASGLNDDAGCLKRTESCAFPKSQK